MKYYHHVDLSFTVVSDDPDPENMSETDMLTQAVEQLISVLQNDDSTIAVRREFSTPDPNKLN